MNLDKSPTPAPAGTGKLTVEKSGSDLNRKIGSSKTFNVVRNKLSDTVTVPKLKY